MGWSLIIMKLTKAQIKKLREAGNGDCYVEDILMESAGRFVSEEMSEITDDKLVREAIEEYRNGFIDGE